MPDAWIEQMDVVGQITASEAWATDTVPVYLERESYIETYIGYLIPLGPRLIRDSLTDTNWAFDFDRARYKIGWRSRGHFLSGSFRNHHTLTHHGDRYFDSNGELAATFRSGDVQIGAPHVQECITHVRRDLITDFLNNRRQRLLYCFRSHRFSERSPGELGLDENYKTVRSEHWHYVQEYRDIAEGQGAEIFCRDRMKTFSFLFGKSAVPTFALTEYDI